jgi:ubiquitin carboxyl-terminal hydrolase 7
MRQWERITNAVQQDNYDLLVTKSGVVEDLIQALIKKAKIPSEEEGGRIRIYETSSHKFFRELERTYPVISINDYTNVVAERIPQEELDVESANAFINVFHFQGEPSRAHGMPFRFLVKEVSTTAAAIDKSAMQAMVTDTGKQGEKFSDTKKRLEKRTGLKGKSFEKIKFAVVRRAHYSRPHYLGDGEFPSALLNARNQLLTP